MNTITTVTDKKTNEVNEIIEEGKEKELYHIRKLKPHDLFVMSNIFSKIGIKELKNNIDKDTLEALSGKNANSIIAGLNIAPILIDILLKHLPLIEGDLYTFLADLAEVEEEAIKNDLDLFMDIIESFVKSKGFNDFFQRFTK